MTSLLPMLRPCEEVADIVHPLSIILAAQRVLADWEAFALPDRAAAEWVAIKPARLANCRVCAG